MTPFAGDPSPDRGRRGVLSDLDLRDLWDEWEREDWVEPAPDPATVASLEAELGYRLPDALIELAQHQNGGRLERGVLDVSDEPGWRRTELDVLGILAIGRRVRYSLGGRFGAAHWMAEPDYPRIGVPFALPLTPASAQYVLDYRECGPSGEPAVVDVYAEDAFRVRRVAPDVATFLRRLGPLPSA